MGWPVFGPRANAHSHFCTHSSGKITMFKVEEFQNYGKEQFDAAVASAGTCTKSLQAIAAAYTDYAKKSYEDSTAFLEKLAGVRSLDKALEVQTDYAKTAYETFVAETTKIGELYKDLAKETYKPFEAFVAKMPKAA
jgi:phasin family protein